MRGLLRLHEATGEPRWLDEAVRLTDEQERRLGSPRGGFFNSADAPDLLVRGKEVFDGAMPGANGVAAHNLLDLAAATGESRFLALAERTLRVVRSPRCSTPRGIEDHGSSPGALRARERLASLG